MFSGPFYVKELKEYKVCNFLSNDQYLRAALFPYDDLFTVCVYLGLDK